MIDQSQISTPNITNRKRIKKKSGRKEERKEYEIVLGSDENEEDEEKEENVSNLAKKILGKKRKRENDAKRIAMLLFICAWIISVYNGIMTRSIITRDVCVMLFLLFIINCLN